MTDQAERDYAADRIAALERTITDLEGARNYLLDRRRVLNRALEVALGGLRANSAAGRELAVLAIESVLAVERLDLPNREDEPKPTDA